MNTRKITYCLLILFISLAGPRPIFHSHDRLLDLGNSPRQLAQHLSTHHRSDSTPLSSNQFHCHWTCGDYCCASNCSADNLGDSPFAIGTPEKFDLAIHQLLFAVDATVVEYLPLGGSCEQFAFEPHSKGSFKSSRDRLQHLCVWTC